MRHGSLFSGIGGFDLAAEWMGWENVFHCEINPFGQKVLKYYWPNAISYEDIKQTDFTIHRGQIDVLSGGFPCQPFSTAGKRKGTEDDRHLWPEMLRAIREISPRYVVGENVRGFTNWNGGMVFDQVQADLEAEGYEVLPFLLPACAVNAPHRRDRIWIVAHRYSNGSQWREEHQAGFKYSERRQTCSEFNSHVPFGPTPDSDDKGLEGATGERIQTEERRRSRISNVEFAWHSMGWDNFPTQPPICQRTNGISTGLDGITISKHRKESIMAYGNAIVPQVAFEIFKVIQEMDLH